MWERERERLKETYRDKATTIGEAVNPNSISFGVTHLMNQKGAKKKKAHSKRQISYYSKWVYLKSILGFLKKKKKRLLRMWIQEMKNLIGYNEF